MKQKLKKAFSIIEAIVAIGVLSIGVLGVSTFFASSARIARLANHMSTATNLAQGVLEEETSKAYADLTPNYPPGGTKTPVSADQNSPFHMYSKQINVTVVDPNLIAALPACPSSQCFKKVDVIIYWNEGDTEKNVQVSTIKKE